MSLTYTSSFKSILNITCKKYMGGLAEPLVIDRAVARLQKKTRQVPSAEGASR